MNPVSGAGEMAAAVGGVLVGALATILGDRYASGHALQGTSPNLVDQPAVGQLYNANASSAPIWSSWKRLVVAGANLVVPFGASMALKKHHKTQTFFQTYFFAAFATVSGKLALDVLPKMLGTKAIGARLLAPEIDAQNALASVKASNLPLFGYQLTAGGTGPATLIANSGGTMLGAEIPGGFPGPLPPSTLPPTGQAPPFQSPGGGVIPRMQAPPTPVSTPGAPTGQAPPFQTPSGGSGTGNGNTPPGVPPAGLTPTPYSNDPNFGCDEDCGEDWDRWSQLRSQDQAAQ